MSLGEARTLPALPPMLVVDRSYTICSVCGHPAATSEGRHKTLIDSQLGSGMIMETVPSDAWGDEPFVPACGAVWTHWTIRAWLAEIGEWTRDDGAMREPLETQNGLIGLAP